jgi:hypothetical protein
MRTHLDKYIPVSVLIKDIRVHELKLADFPAPVPALLLQLLVRELGLGVLVQVLHVRVSRARVEIVVQLLDVLAVIAWSRQLTSVFLFCGVLTLRTIETEKPLLQDRVLAVPKRE